MWVFGGVGYATRGEMREVSRHGRHRHAELLDVGMNVVQAVRMREAQCTFFEI